MISLQENLIRSFQLLGLTRAEAEIAAKASGANPANRSSEAEFFQDILQPERNR